MKIKFQQYYYASSTRQPINISKNDLAIKKVCEEFWEPCLIYWDKRHFLLTISPSPLEKLTIKFPKSYCSA